ncbi:MAG: hypothetical protein ACPGVH_01735 [Chitinophagales bacterium]
METFRDLVVHINNTINAGNADIKNFQQYRTNKYKYKSVRRTFLNTNKSFVKKDNYTYHRGGSGEFQYNVSDEGVHFGNQIFRFGLAFSLESSQSINDPINDRLEEIKAFNKFVKEYPEYFNGYEMWIFDKQEGTRTENFDVKTIDSKDIKLGNFIFIGKWFNKTTQEINDSDISVMIETFDYLFPLYKHIFGEEPFSYDKRYARLTWNTESWHTPIKHTRKKIVEGKKMLHEHKYGYGHEEWLFNPRYNVNGFQYGMIEGVNSMKADQEFVKELTLYTINPISSERFLVGKLTDVEIIKDYENELKIIRPYFDKSKKIMIQELKNVQADYLHFKNKKKLEINVKFSMDKAEIYDDLIPAPYLKNQKFTRFTTYIIKNHPELFNAEEEEEKNDIFQAGEGSVSEGYERNNKSSKTKVIRSHTEITNTLRDYLIQEWKLNADKQLSVEKTRVKRSLIDVMVEKDKRHYIFEVKTTPTARKNIREALGQLLEYSYYGNNWNMKKMIIVGYGKPTEDDKKYLSILNNAFEPEIEYWTFINDDVQLKHKFKIHKYK